MKIAYSKICINPSYPIKQAGFIQQQHPIYNFKDDLHARILAFEDEKNLAYHVSLDILGIPVDVQNYLKNELQKKTNKKVSITLSATHTHFGGHQKDIRYLGEITSKLLYAFDYLNFYESDSYTISYQCEPFEGVGKSRISNHQAKVLLQYYTIYHENKPIIGIIVHNCHPTIHHGDTPYFTAEYPGYAVEELKRRHPEMDFTFIQGAAGDVSTRFTRKGQDHQAMFDLGNNLVEEVEKLMLQDTLKQDFKSISYEYEVLPLSHEFNPIDLSKMPQNLTERELETIQVGIQVRENLSHELETLTKQVMISKLELGPYKIVFCPNEAFSSYIDCIDTTKCSLAAYSNGYSPYITGIEDNFITYEKFTDTVTKESKIELMNLLKKFGK
ncbi:MAG: hypothetical protein ACI4U3_01475 [Traorella sp.]